MKIGIYMPDYLVDMLKDDEVQQVVYGKLYDYLKKHGKINLSLTVRTIIMNYLEEHGYLDRKYPQ